jgi:hypothetical protein
MDYNKRKQDAKIQTAEMKILRNVAGPDKENKKLGTSWKF